MSSQTHSQVGRKLNAEYVGNVIPAPPLRKITFMLVCACKNSKRIYRKPVTVDMSQEKPKIQGKLPFYCKLFRRVKYIFNCVQ